MPLLHRMDISAGNNTFGAISGEGFAEAMEQSLQSLSQLLFGQGGKGGLRG